MSAVALVGTRRRKAAWRKNEARLRDGEDFFLCEEWGRVVGDGDISGAPNWWGPQASARFLRCGDGVSWRQPHSPTVRILRAHHPMLPRLLPCRRLLQALTGAAAAGDLRRRAFSSSSSAASSPSLSIWRRKKEMGKEGLMVVAQLKRLAALPPAGRSPRLEQFMRSHVSRLLRTDLLAVLAELLRQDHVVLSMKIYGVVRKEIWYRPDMYFYRDMLYMLARNKKVDETRQVWADLKSEDVLFDQHTYGDIVRAYTDAGLIDLAMEIYEDMRSSPDPPLSLPFRVILKGLVPYSELREKIKQDFLELFPDMIVYDPPDCLSDVDEEFKF